MGVRKVGRCRIAVNGREFVWWMPNEGAALRIASADKKFVVSYSLAYPTDAQPIIRISGSEFPGISPGEKRPVYVLPPQFDHYYSFKGLARRIIQWSLRPRHRVERIAPEPGWYF